MDRNRMLSSLIALLLLTALLCGCASGALPAAEAAQPDPEAAERSTVYVDSMDTFMELTAYGSNRTEALKAAKLEIERLNAMLSIGLEESEISRVNRNGGGQVSGETAEMISEALALNRETMGAFDLTVYPLMELWGFVSKNYHVPSGEELSDTLARVSSSRVSIDENRVVTLGEGQAIDLGGIAKGYTSQRLMELFSEHGVTSAIVSLGGNIQVLGTKPDGSNWRIGVKDPANPEFGLSAIVSVADKAVITSGGYERYFMDPESGTIYRHIIDPATGYPAESGLASVSIVTDDGMLGDGLSTALYIMGLEKAGDFWRQHSEDFEAIFIDNDGDVYITAGLEGSVTSDRQMHIIR